MYINSGDERELSNKIEQNSESETRLIAVVELIAKKLSTIVECKSVGIVLKLQKSPSELGVRYEDEVSELIKGKLHSSLTQIRHSLK